ncbi:hypothetical protein ACF0H5_016283 [Mactra antiquata]
MGERQNGDAQFSSDEVFRRLAALEQTVVGLKEENQRLVEEMSALKAQVEHMQYHSTIQNDSIREKRQAIESVAFTAGVIDFDLKNLGAHQTIIFDHAITNIGNAYHTNTGIFTAPVHGVYSFILTFMVVPGKSAYLEIIAGTRNVNDIYATSPTGGGHASTTKQWVLELNKGDEVWIRNKDQGADIHGYMHTLLSGFLLFITE